MNPRVAVLGGGVGGVTAALQLSQPGWQQHYDAITLYQMGWRLGGKGASGRGEHDRIEEHGLHVWFGFYENAFRLLDECHRELDDIAAAGGPGSARWPVVFADVETSFTATDRIGLTDHDGCCWEPWLADFFEPSDDRPWLERPAHASHPSEWSIPYYFARSLHLAAVFARSLPAPGAVSTSASTPVSSVDLLGDVAELAGKFLDLVGLDAGAALSLAAEGAELIAHEAAASPLVREALSVVLALSDHALDLLRIQFDHELREHTEIRRAWYLIDIFVAVARGLVDDEVIVDDDLQRIDHEDFRAWLRRHGASPDSIDCALVRSIVYDLAFAFDGGDPNRPSCGAGTALRGVFRMFFTYRGSLMFKMNSGMGDVIFAPIYELLVKRGVDVEFFHRVEEVRVAGGSITEIVVDQQAVVPPTVTPRDFLGGSGVMNTGSGAATWPASPIGVLTGGQFAVPPNELTQAGGSAYESWYVGRQAVRTGTKILAVGVDFDHVVYALPISTVAQCAPDLLALPNWAAASHLVRTVPTQAMQLWLDRPASQLGPWPDGIVVGGYVEPYDTWADMSQLHGQEAVPGAATVAYFCSALWDSEPPVTRGDLAAHEWLAEQKALVVAQGRRFLERDIGALWPEAVDPLSGALDWDVLVAPAGVQGRDRFDHQYVRANVEPSERYVLSVPGSSFARVHPADTGIDNLFAAGDWTENVINAGCVEAAVISGLRAANGIHHAVGWTAAIVDIIADDHP